MSRSYRHPRRPTIELIEPRLLLSTSVPTTQVDPIAAVYETTPVEDTGDAADDIAVWVNPVDRGASAIIGTNKQGSLNVYHTDGTLISSVGPGDFNGVDLRTGFRLGAGSVTLVATNDRTNDTIRLFTLNPVTRALTEVTAAPIVHNGSGEVYGLTMYRDNAGRYFVFCVTTNGVMNQWLLRDNGLGRVSGTLVRSFDVGGTTEGMVVDDHAGFLFVAEEGEGIWRYGANPLDGSSRLSVDTVGGGGHLSADVEGLALYKPVATSPNGYLIASNQGTNSFVVYDLVGYTYITEFSIGSANGIDATSNTDGIEVVAAGLGGHLSEGAFIAQDGSNTGGNQNFKLVSWGDIARAQGEDLWILATTGPGANQPPTVWAGNDATARTAEGTAVLNGFVGDHNGPLPKPIMWWEQVSGPGTVTFRYQGQPKTIAEFSQTGTYVLRLGAYDGQVMSLDYVTVVAGPFNTGPVLNTGGSKTIVGNSTTLNGTVTDDGINFGGVIQWWEVLSKPAGAAVTLRHEGVATTPATFSTPGVYQLRLGAYDGDVMNLDTITITVVGGANPGPTVNAGPDVTLSNATATITGSISDSGGPNALITWWEVLSRPAGSTVSLQYQGVPSTPMTFSAPGVYVLRLGSYDGEHMTLDEKTVTVLSTAF